MSFVGDFFNTLIGCATREIAASLPIPERLHDYRLMEKVL
jgi:hypothetical protein